MDILTVDQHDKWKRFGLWLHLGLDPFAGHLAWLKVWWNNQNPRLITSYYIEAGRKVSGASLSNLLITSSKHEFSMTGIPLLPKVIVAQRIMESLTVKHVSAIILTHLCKAHCNIAGVWRRAISSQKLHGLK